MKKILWIIATFALLYIIASKIFIYIAPPTEEEIVGKYFSKFEEKEYILTISSDKKSKLKVLQNGKVFYEDECEKYHIEKAHYRTFSTYYLAFSKCKQMDSHAILKRGLLFNILIGNDGTEMERIDPDANVFYRQ
jgi:hypothetical protein